MRWLLLLGLLAMPVQASLLSVFEPVGPPQIVQLDAALLGGITLSGQFTGLFAVHTSGYSVMYPGERTDAFYNYMWDWVPATPSHTDYGMTYSFSGNAACFEGDGRGIDYLIRYIDNVGYVPACTIPAYSPYHEYDFVIDIGPVARTLTLGSGDGGIWDNSDGVLVTIQAVQVRATPIPEPSSWAVVLLALVGLFTRKKLS